MLTDWRGLCLAAVLLTTTYVQIVGKNVELLSGFDRLRNLGTYRYLFGGPPWIQWLMFRWSGFIQIAIVVAAGVLFGWKAAILTAVAPIVFGFAIWRIARGHAVGMIEDVQKRIRNVEPGSEF